MNGENNIIEDKYIRYYFNEDSIDNLINQILFDRMTKVQKYGKKNYISFMSKNRTENALNTEGFWKQARIINDPHFGATCNRR